MKPKIYIPILALAVGAAIALCFTGCQSTPYGWEGKFFTIQTNYLPPIVVVQTNQVFTTNTIVKEVAVTNWTTGLPEIVVQPIRETFVTSQALVTYGTNVNVECVFTAKTNTTAIGQTLGSLVNLVAPGSGGLAMSGFAGLVALYAGWRNRRLKKATGVLAQGIEIYGEVTKAMGPTGDKIDKQVKRVLQLDQAQAGVLKDVMGVLDNTVDNEEAKEAAEAIRKIVG
jgi:hypothetical protein